MEPGTQILLSGALTFGVPLALAIRELVLLRRARGGPGRRDAAAAVPPPPLAPGGTRPLPACLVPAAPDRPAARVRVMEDA
jgi:hypothetical protein